MGRRLPLDALDSRTVLTGYALAIGISGAVLLAWGDVWLGGPLAGNSWGRDTITRVAGALVVAAACCAWALSRVKDPADRRRGLTWLLIAHAVVLMIGAIQVFVVWGQAVPLPAYWSLVALASVTTALFVGWGRHAGDTAPFSAAVSRLFGEPPLTTTALLRSEYEAQLRLAGAREERQRFARDLHDSVKQQVFAVQTAAATAEVRIDHDAGGAREAIARIRDAARDAMVEMDAMLDQLRTVPIENTGLIEGLRRQVEACGLRTGAEVTFGRSALPPSETWRPGAHEALFRAAQEALSNVARHARANHVHVALGSTPFHVTLDIRDDGCGFDPGARRSGMGLENIRSRIDDTGGSVEIASTDGGGTHVAIAIPYDREEPRPFLKRAVVSAAVAVLMVAGALTARPARATYIILAAPALIDATRYLIAARRARRLSRSAA